MSPLAGMMRSTIEYRAEIFGTAAIADISLLKICCTLCLRCPRKYIMGGSGSVPSLRASYGVS